MALPIIIVDSATGSDTAASGAGPGDGTTSGSALTGSSASTSSNGLTVTLDGSPDLSGVATDGSHVIYLADTTAGARNFGKITAKDNSAKTVTVSDAFGLSLSGKSWAIGGKRQKIGSTTSAKLFDNNSAAGDAMAGWIIELQSGHSEATNQIICRRSGNTTSGPVTVRGQANYTTMPKLTGSSIFRQLNSTYLVIERLHFECTASGGYAIQGSSQYLSVIDCKFTRTSTFTWLQCIAASSGTSIRGCEISYATTGISGNDGLNVTNNYIHHNTTGISTASSYAQYIAFNILYANSGDGINSGQSSNELRSIKIVHNTIDANGGDGIEFTASVGDSLINLVVMNNILSNNGGYGLNFSNASMTDTYMQVYRPLISGNNTYNNTSGAYKNNTAVYSYNNCPWADSDSGANPSYTNASGGNFGVGAGLKATGFPVGGLNFVGGTSATYSYIDPGASQRQEPAFIAPAGTFKTNIGTY